MAYDRNLIWKLRKCLPELEYEEGWHARTPFEKQEIIQTLLRAQFESNAFMRALNVDVTYLGMKTEDEGELIQVHVYDP